MSEPRVRVHHPKGIQGVEKTIALHAVASYCHNNDLSVQKLSEQIYDVYDNIAIFAAPSEAEPDGLRNDMAARPLPVLIVENKNGELDIRQTEHTRKYLAN